MRQVQDKQCESRLCPISLTGNSDRVFQLRFADLQVVPRKVPRKLEVAVQQRPNSNVTRSPLRGDEMPDERRFVESDKGVHLLSPLMGEYCLCGDPVNEHNDETIEGHGSFRETMHRVVTCEDCVRVIRCCQGCLCGIPPS